MKMIKDNIIKEVPKNLVDMYLALGWKEYKEKPQFEETFSMKSERKSFTTNKKNKED